MPDPARRVAGYCPMGCGQTLLLGEGGYVTCSSTGCSRPDAVATILEDRETDHVVRLDPNGFTVRHPTRERLEDLLLDCDLHLWIAAHDAPPHQPGLYRVRGTDGDWSSWEPLPAASSEGGGRGRTDG